MIVAVTESWLDADITDSLLDPLKYYNIFRRDRGSAGGGVCVFCHRSITCVRVDVADMFKDVEIVVIKVLTSNYNYNFNFNTVYRPPACKDQAVCIKSVCDLPNKNNTIMVGDFNLPNINWQLQLAPNDNICIPFLSCLSQLSLTQYVRAPTRENNCLDLILCDDSFLIETVCIREHFGNSDHNMIEFNLSADFNYNVDGIDCDCSKCIIYDFTHADYQSLAADLSLVNCPCIVS